MEERLAMSINETAKRIGASSTAVRRWVRDGELPSVRIAGRIFIPYEALRKRLGLEFDLARDRLDSLDSEGQHPKGSESQQES